MDTHSAAQFQLFETCDLNRNISMRQCSHSKTKGMPVSSSRIDETVTYING